MTEWLLILGVLAILAIFLIVRYRRQIQTGIYIFKMFRKMREMSRPPKMTEKQIDNANSNEVQLVRCAKCGTWLPQNTALKFSKNTFYCSSKCVETAVKA